MDRLRKGSHGGLVIGTLTLPMGLLIIFTHNRWVLDWPVVITMMGWMMTLKSVVYLLHPSSFDRLIDTGAAREQSYRRVGIVMVLLGGLATYGAFR